MGAVTAEEEEEEAEAAEGEVAAEVVRSSVPDNKPKRSASPGRPSPITRSLSWKRGSSIRSTCHLPTAMR
jgi:hypothetical protein